MRFDDYGWVGFVHLLYASGNTLIVPSFYHLLALVFGCKATHLLRKKRKQEMFIELSDIDGTIKA